MKKNIVWAFTLGVLALSSCGSDTKESKVVEEVINTTEEVAEDSKKVEEVAEKLNSGAKELRTSTEAAKTEIDGLLKDL